MKEGLRKMSDKLATAIVEEGKFTAGNKSAGVRLRGLLQEIKCLATEVRSAVLTASKGGE
jgi:hypothetical protein